MEKKTIHKKEVHRKEKKPFSIFRFVIIFVAILLLGMFVFNRKSIAPSQSPKQAEKVFDFGNSQIALDDTKLKFVNGNYRVYQLSTGPHIATISKRTLNQDGNRAAAIIVDNPGGSGEFYYVVGAILKDGKQVYSNPMPLGDRIKVLTVNVTIPGSHDNGIVTINYLDRPENASMSTAPSERKTKQFAFEENGNLKEVKE